MSSLHNTNHDSIELGKIPMQTTSTQSYTPARSRSTFSVDSAATVRELGDGPNKEGFDEQLSHGKAKVSISTEKPKYKKSRKRVFAQKRGLPNSQPANFNTDDYEQKYPEDELGQELGPNARFYRVYIDEHEKYRFELVEGWKDNLDVLLVFAGLFSAVVTTIVVEASRGIQPDYAQLTTTMLSQQTAILSQMFALQRGMPTNDTLAITEVETAFVPSAGARWVNGLWYTSLALSLATALIAVVAKQWLQSYMISPVGTPQARGRLLHLRFTSLERWQVPAIIGLLPFLLHLSLLLFFCGLTIYLMPIDRTIGLVVGSIGLACYLAYLTTTTLSIITPTCPYKTPLSQIAYSFLRSLILSTYTTFRSLCEKIYSSFNIEWFDEWYRRRFDLMALRIKALRSSSTLVLREQDLLKSSTDFALDIDHEMILWMHSFSFSPSATSITLQALFASPPSDKRCANERCANDLCLEARECISNDEEMTLKRDRLVSAALMYTKEPLHIQQWMIDPGRKYFLNAPHNRLLPHRSAWVAILRRNLELSAGVALLAWRPDRFETHWGDTPDSENGMYSVRHLVLGADVHDEEVTRQTLLRAICRTFAQWTDPGPAQVLFEQLSHPKGERVENSNLKAVALLATIIQLSRSGDMYPAEVVIDEINVLAREFCAVLRGDSTNEDATNTPDEEICLNILHGMWRCRDQVPRLHEYVQEQIRQYESKHARRKDDYESQDQAERGQLMSNSMVE